VGDPFTELAHISSLNSALDQARQRAQRNIPSIDHVRHDIDAADRAIYSARSLIEGHRELIGADARTRLAEAERLRTDSGTLVSDEDSRERARDMARRSGQLANEAMHVAQRDIDQARRSAYNNGYGGNPGWGGPTGGNVSGGNMLGGLIGGAILGSIIGDIFD